MKIREIVINKLADQGYDGSGLTDEQVGMIYRAYCQKLELLSPEYRFASAGFLNKTTGKMVHDRDAVVVLSQVYEDIIGLPICQYEYGDKFIFSLEWGDAYEPDENGRMRKVLVRNERASDNHDLQSQAVQGYKSSNRFAVLTQKPVAIKTIPAPAGCLERGCDYNTFTKINFKKINVEAICPRIKKEGQITYLPTPPTADGKLGWATMRQTKKKTAWGGKTPANKPGIEIDFAHCFPDRIHKRGAKKLGVNLNARTLYEQRTVYRLELWYGWQIALVHDNGAEIIANIVEVEHPRYGNEWYIKPRSFDPLTSPELMSQIASFLGLKYDTANPDDKGVKVVTTAPQQERRVKIEPKPIGAIASGCMVSRAVKDAFDLSAKINKQKIKEKTARKKANDAKKRRKARV